MVDISVYAEVLRGDGRLAGRLDELDQVLVCPVVEGELLYGALCSARTERNLREVTAMPDAGTHTAIGHLVPHIYAQVRKQLRGAGSPIPSNDIWIAACAIAEDAILVARDAHFSEVEGLTVEQW